MVHQRNNSWTLRHNDLRSYRGQNADFAGYWFTNSFNKGGQYLEKKKKEKNLITTVALLKLSFSLENKLE